MPTDAPPNAPLGPRAMQPRQKRGPPKRPEHLPSADATSPPINAPKAPKAMRTDQNAGITKEELIKDICAQVTPVLDSIVNRLIKNTNALGLLLAQVAGEHLVVTWLREGLEGKSSSVLFDTSQESVRATSEDQKEALAPFWLMGRFFGKRIEGLDAAQRSTRDVLDHFRSFFWATHSDGQHPCAGPDKNLDRLHDCAVGTWLYGSLSDFSGNSRIEYILDNIVLKEAERLLPWFSSGFWFQDDVEAVLNKLTKRVDARLNHMERRAYLLGLRQRISLSWTAPAGQTIHKPNLPGVAPKATCKFCMAEFQDNHFESGQRLVPGFAVPASIPGLDCSNPHPTNSCLPNMNKATIACLPFSGPIKVCPFDKKPISKDNVHDHTTCAFWRMQHYFLQAKAENRMRSQAPLLSLDRALSEPDFEKLESAFVKYIKAFKHWRFALDPANNEQLAVTGLVSSEPCVPATLLPIRPLAAVFHHNPPHSYERVECEPSLFLVLHTKVNVAGSVKWVVKGLLDGAEPQIWAMTIKSRDVSRVEAEGRNLALRPHNYWQTTSRHRAVGYSSNSSPVEGEPLLPSIYNITPTRFTPQPHSPTV